MVSLARGAPLLHHVMIRSIEDGKFKIPNDTGRIDRSHPQAAFVLNFEY
jgi:hypothetical protein